MTSTIPIPLISDAVFSPCQTWRYLLRRIWDHDVPPCYWIMLNPSTADAEKNDPTVTRCIKFSHRWGHGGCVVLNIFAYRSTDPRGLRTYSDPIGPVNDAFISGIPEDATVVCAWGEWGSLNDRARDVLKILKARPMCLGVNKSGHPKHPLYVKGDTALMGLEMDGV